MTIRPLYALIIIWLGLSGGLLQADEASASHPRRNVIYITWDGFRWQEFFGGAQQTYLSKDAGVDKVELVTTKYWRETESERREALLPFVWNTIAKQGQIFGDQTQHAPARIENKHKFSYPGYSEMFSGYPDDERINSNQKVPNPNITVLEFLNGRPGLTGKVSAVATWDVFPSIFNVERSKIYVHAGLVPVPTTAPTDRERMLNELISDAVILWHDNQLDTLTMQAAREHLLKDKPRVLFIGLGETDEWGHARRYDRYLHAAHRADDFVRRFWELVQSLPDYRDQTTICIAPDHGRGSSIRDWTDHGAKIEGAEYIWMAVLGPDTPAIGVRSDVEVTLSQIAATLASAVGEDFTASNPKVAKPLPGAIQH
ncbi:alkaline phosphatase family protein [Schlesneria paludicola]|uniref:alkaline phosphatase family protein n=1 Tax=Schlesneria paludicola TaxID=360056 RepID=UPI00029B444C|nr:alkaline phosphatase family protein [Schlesneria paludicola]